MNSRFFRVLSALDIIYANNRGEDEVNDCVRKEGDDKADDCVKDCVFRVGDFFRVAARENIAETAINKHNNRDDTDDEENDVCDSAENAVVADQFRRHAGRTSGFSALFNSGFWRFFSVNRDGFSGP